MAAVAREDPSIAGFPGGTVRVREEGAQIKIEEFYLPGY